MLKLLGADWLQYIRTSENSIAEPSMALTRLRLCHHTQNELWKVVTLGICYQSFIIFMQSATGKQKKSFGTSRVCMSMVVQGDSRV